MIQLLYLICGAFLFYLARTTHTKDLYLFAAACFLVSVLISIKKL